MPFRFLHLADLHLETRFGGSEATRARLREATLEAFDAAVDLVLEGGLDALLIAGDAYDDPLLSRRTELHLLRGLRRVAESGATVVMACGNHDPGGAGKRAAQFGLEAGGDWRARVHLLRGARPQVVTVPGRDGAPVGLVIGAGHASEREERNLAARLTPQATDLPVVGLLHTQVHSALDADQHDPYAPCGREDLAHLGYDYYALGHVHLRQRPFPDLPAWYPGNLQGRNPRERGPKGGLRVELHAGEPAAPQFVPLAPVVWDRARVDDLAGCTSAQALLDHLTAVVARQVGALAGRELVLVLELAGACPVARALREPDDRRAYELDLAEQGGALEVQLRSALRPPRDLLALRAVPSVLGQAFELLELAREDPQVLASLAPDELTGLESEGEDARLRYLTRLLDGMEDELLARCLEDPA